MPTTRAANGNRRFPSSTQQLRCENVRVETWTEADTRDGEDGYAAAPHAVEAWLGVEGDDELAQASREALTDALAE